MIQDNVAYRHEKRTRVGMTGWENDPLRIVQETKIWQRFMQKPKSIQENETLKILWHFEIQTDHSILARRPDFVLIDKKEKTYHLVDFTVPVDNREKNK